MLNESNFRGIFEGHGVELIINCVAQMSKNVLVKILNLLSGTNKHESNISE